VQRGVDAILLPSGPKGKGREDLGGLKGMRHFDYTAQRAHNVAVSIPR